MKSHHKKEVKIWKLEIRDGLLTVKITPIFNLLNPVKEQINRVNEIKYEE